MKKVFVRSALASLGCIALAGAVSAQIVVEPGTEFPAAPVSKGGFSLSAPAQVLAPAAAPAPVAAPAPEPAPTKRRKRRRS